MPGSDVFGAATSDRADCGSPAALDDLDPCTWLLWCYPTTLTGGRKLYNKGSTGIDGKRISLDGAGGNLNVRVARATVTNYISNTLPLGTNVWEMVAATFRSAASAGEVVNILRGDQDTALAETGYGTAADGSGTVTSEATHNAYIGNDGGFASAFQGRIAMLAVFNVELTAADCEKWRRRPRRTVGSEVARGFWRLGKGGDPNCLDYSGNGNHGTVTGATLGDGVPLDQGELLTIINGYNPTTLEA